VCACNAAGNQARGECACEGAPDCTIRRKLSNCSRCILNAIRDADASVVDRLGTGCAVYNFRETDPTYALAADRLARNGSETWAKRYLGKIGHEAGRSRRTEKARLVVDISQRFRRAVQADVSQRPRCAARRVQVFRACTSLSR
jgi:hypothetical protein